MVAKCEQVVQNGKSPRQENCAFRRVLDWPAVNSVCNSLQKTYFATKKVHPLMTSMCVASERGIQCATYLATWSVRPVLEKLEPQLSAANALACQGLDRLERKIPALHQPVEKVTTHLKESIFAYIQNAMRTTVGILNNIWGMAAESYEHSENRVKNTMEHMRRSRLSVAAETGIDVTMDQLEKVMDFFLQKAEDQPDPELSEEESPTPMFGKIRAFVAAVSQQVYKQTAQTVRRVSDKGWGRPVWISGLTAQSPEHNSPLGSLAQTLQTAYLSTVLLVRNAPSLARNAAGQLLRVSSVHEAASERGANTRIVQSVVGQLLQTIFRYLPVSKAKEKEKGVPKLTADCPESAQEKDGTQMETALAQEFLLVGQARDARRLSRGHYPLAFINLDDPAPSCQNLQSPHFKAENMGLRMSAFSPYKEGAGRRRWSEGLFRISPEVKYTLSQYTSLYGSNLKKD